MLLVSLTVGCVQMPCSGEKVGFGEPKSLPIEKDLNRLQETVFPVRHGPRLPEGAKQNVLLGAVLARLLSRAASALMSLLGAIIVSHRFRRSHVQLPQLFGFCQSRSTRSAGGFGSSTALAIQTLQPSTR